MTTEKKKKENFNIPGASEIDRATFRAIAAELPLRPNGKKPTQAEILTHILTVYEQSKHLNASADARSNSILATNYERKIRELTAKIEDLEKAQVNQNSEALSQLESENAALKKELIEAQNHAAALENQPKGIELTGNHYIFNPGTLTPKIQRCLAYLIKRNKLEKKTVPEMLQEFTYRGMHYYIENAFDI